MRGGYLEGNIVDGRRRAADLLVRWMEPLKGRSVLDLGCGRGGLAGLLAERGARVTAVDLLPRFESQLGRENPDFMIGDGFSVARDRVFDDILVSEVLEDYQPDEAARVLESLGPSRGNRMFLILRVAGPFSRLWNALSTGGLGGNVDPYSILRTIHASTPFRLTRQETVHLRNYRVWLVQLLRSDANLETPFHPMKP
jgi:SAM-dependent methyltransferase